MDKIAANNHIVELRKEVKHARAMVAGNLIRKIKELNKAKEKAKDEEAVAKIDKKIDRIHSETKLLKSLDCYKICKDITLKPDSKHWNNMIGDEKAPPEDRLAARVMCKNNVLKQVTKFRNDNKDCDEWLEEYFEFREKKNEIKKKSSKKNRRGKPSKSQQIDSDLLSRITLA